MTGIIATQGVVQLHMNFQSIVEFNLKKKLFGTINQSSSKSALKVPQQTKNKYELEINLNNRNQNELS